MSFSNFSKPVELQQCMIYDFQILTLSNGVLSFPLLKIIPTEYMYPVFIMPSEPGGYPRGGADPDLRSRGEETPPPPWTARALRARGEPRGEQIRFPNPRGERINTGSHDIVFARRWRKISANVTVEKNVLSLHTYS